MNSYLKNAYASAMSKPMPGIAVGYIMQSFKNLIALCAELSRLNGGRTFRLSTRDAAELIGVEDGLIVGRYFGRLKVDGVVEVVNKGQKGQAPNEYRWLAGKEQLNEFEHSNFMEVCEIAVRMRKHLNELLKLLDWSLRFVQGGPSPELEDALREAMAKTEAVLKNRDVDN